MRSIYDIFIVVLIIFKIFYVMSTIRLKIIERTDSKNKYELNEVRERNNKLLILTDIGLYILLMIVFLPTTNQAVTVSGHEKILFFALGVISLMHVDYEELFSNP